MLILRAEFCPRPPLAELFICVTAAGEPSLTLGAGFNAALLIKTQK